MKTYVDRNINIFEGEEAEKLFKDHNDKKYLIQDIGIPKVDLERWKEAQAYERKTWCDSVIMSNDRNEVHEQNFERYEQLHNILPYRIDMIELGCGPFTNLRLILPKLSYKSIGQIDLLDPLINQYIKYTGYCTYRNHHLNGKLVNLINCAIEDYETTKKYDLVVMINVIEHCFDVDLIFEKILSLLNDGGIFIFGDKFLKEENINEIHDRYYDAGHPIKLTYNYIKETIDNNFNAIYTKTYIDEHNYENVYKILKK